MKVTLYRCRDARGSWWAAWAPGHKVMTTPIGGTANKLISRVRAAWCVAHTGSEVLTFERRGRDDPYSPAELAAELAGLELQASRIDTEPTEPTDGARP